MGRDGQRTGAVGQLSERNALFVEFIGCASATIIETTNDVRFGSIADIVLLVDAGLRMTGSGGGWCLSRIRFSTTLFRLSAARRRSSSAPRRRRTRTETRPTLPGSCRSLSLEPVGPLNQ